MKSIFVAEDFISSKFATAQDKADFANWLIDFIDSGFKQTKFFKARYTRLSNCFGHIAHFNQLGFYEHWFENAAKQRMFIDNILRWPCYGDPLWTFSDVETKIKKYLRERLG